MRVPLASRLALALLVPATALAAPLHQDPTVGAEQPADAVDYVGSAFAQSNPAVAYDGTQYWAVWDGPSWYQGVPATRMTRVTTAGAVLDPEGIVAARYASPPTLYGLQLAEAQLGANRALVWVTGAAQGEAVELALLDATGAVVTTTTLATASALGNPYVQVSSSGDHLVVSYSLAQGFGVVAVDSGGNVVAQVTGLTSAAAVAANAPSFLVATATAATRYGYDGTKLGSVAMPAPPSGTAAIGAAAGPNDDVVFLEQQVAYAGAPTCCGALSALRVGPNDTLEDAAPIALGSAIGQPAAAWNGTAWQLTWVAAQGQQPTQIQAALLGANGQLSAPTSLATYAAGAAATSITPGPAGQTLVAWASSTNDVLGVRLDATGKALDASPIILSTTAREESDPAVAHGQGAYLGVWKSEDRGIAGLLLDDTGKPLGGGPILVTSQVAIPNVVALGDQFVVSWMMPGSTSTYQAARVGADGSVKGAPTTVPGSILAAGGGVLFAMNGGQAAIVDSSLHTVAGPNAIGQSGASPSAAWNGTKFYVAWSDYSAVGSAFYGRSALVATDGTITTLPNLGLNVLPSGMTAIGEGRVLVAYSTPNGSMLQVVDANGAPLGASVTLDPGTFDGVPRLASDADGRAMAELQPSVVGTNRVQAPGQAVTIDFSTGSLVVGTPFPISHAAFDVGDAIASDGVTGRSVVFRGSTTDYQRDPRMAFQTIQAPVPPPACDGGCAPASDGGAPPTGGGGIDGVDGGATPGGPAPTGPAGDAGASNGAAPGGSSSGCACREGPPSHGGTPGAWLAALGVVATAARARRTRRSART
jgi:hypothetical protein